MDKAPKYETFLITLSQWVAGNEQMLIRTALRNIGGYTDEQIDMVFKKIREKE